MRFQPASAIPRPRPGIDIRQLPIGPEEAFVFSRVDGRTTAREIGYATSLAEAQVVEHLERLASLGALDFIGVEPAAAPTSVEQQRVACPALPVASTQKSASVLHPEEPARLRFPLSAPSNTRQVSGTMPVQPPAGGQTQPASSSPRVTSTPTSAGSAQPLSSAPSKPIAAATPSSPRVTSTPPTPAGSAQPLSSAPSKPIAAATPSSPGASAATPVPGSPPVTSPGSASSPLYDVRELDATADLDVSRRQQILDLFYRLDTFDHYELLGIPTNADRRAVKAAYYEKVKIFHPDRYFGKDLGPFRTKLEQCFARLTQAHDTLATADSREEYDAYLESQRQTKELERALSQTVTISDFDLLEQQLEESLRLTAEIPPISSADVLPNPETLREPVVQVIGSQPPGAVPKMSDEERKRYLARKLRVSSANLRATSKTPSAPPAPSTPPPSRQQLAEQLRRQLGASRRDSMSRQVENHLAAADTAMTENNPVAAANSLRIAQSLAPDDPNIAQRLSEAQSLAAMALADTYLHQGEYEEKSGRFEAAALSYGRAAQGKPSAQVWEAAARCVFEAGKDLRTAADYARKSVTMDSERPTSHLLLGQIFLAAQMRTSAIAELERARRLDPNNDTVLSLLKRLANKEI